LEARNADSVKRNDATTQTTLMASKLFSWPSLFSSTDEQAMWRVRTDDDPQAFAQLVERWQRPIQSLCTRMMGDLHRGEDLAQETFARLFARRKKYEPTGKFSTFLWRMALNICYDELRKLKRRGEFSLDEHDDEHSPFDLEADGPTPDSQLVEDERAEAVRHALIQLAEPYRVVVVLRHYEGLKFREIGDVLGIPEGTVKSRMSEALSQLNRILNPMISDQPKPTQRSNERLFI
jgi:RNA polymerase sigma-70 factor (ECF subfamily)